MKRNAKKDLTQGPILKSLLLFALPLIATNLLQQFYNTADQIVVGKFAGDAALASVGATTSVSSLMLNLFVGLSVGATITCAKFCGAKDKEHTGKTVHTAITLALTCGIVMAVLGISLSGLLLKMTDTPRDIFNSARLYMCIIFAGTPFSLTYNFGAGILRAAGETKYPLYILGVSGLVNVLLNLLLVIGFDMAEAGVGLATVTSQVISSVWVLYLLINRNDDLKLELKKLRFHKSELLNIIKLGIPAGLNAILYDIANIALQTSINTYGKEFIAASTAANSISNYISITQNSLGTATISFVGQNYGAKDYKRIKRIVWISLATTLAITTAMSLSISLFPEFFLGLFTKNPEVVKNGIGKTLIMCLGYIIFVPTTVLGSTLRGIEKPNLPLLINVVAIFLSRILWINFIYPLHPTFNMLFYCYPVSWFLSAASLVTAYFFAQKKFPITK